MREVEDQGKYLGLPAQIGRSKREIFSYIEGKVEDRLRGWTGKMLSQAGNEVMIKLVTSSSISIYVMNCFKLPMGLIDNLNTLMAKFLWENTKDDKGIHWRSWEKLCEDKFDGGLGFKDLECMNRAMLAK
ncbi:hypothetical protein LIER_30000 [Lithospermum erythrorhizon]|uniref:Reverse transcriptase n=1 Tax=Lithospermum erythrorhizon TaxID=34254 RepID=A0AAV3RRC3_LITER